MLAVDVGQGVEDAFSDVASFVPKLLGFLVILTTRAAMTRRTTGSNGTMSGAPSCGAEGLKELRKGLRNASSPPSFHRAEGCVRPSQRRVCVGPRARSRNHHPRAGVMRYVPQLKGARRWQETRNGGSVGLR